MGAAVGLWQAIEERNIADEQNALTLATMRSQAEEEGRAEGKMKVEEKNAKAANAAKAATPDIDYNDGALKRKKGVQSTFTATGAGAGNMKGTTLSPLGGDNEE